MKGILRTNPEIARYLWLELSPQRLIAMPAILALLVFFVLTISGEGEYWNSVHYLSFYGIIIIGFLWGMKNASDAILDEYNEKTWDWQRMSNIGPWKLTLGKLFGATVYNWYGVLLCWILFMFSAPYTEAPKAEIQTGFTLLFALVAFHGIMILSALLLARRIPSGTRIRSNRIFLGGILFAIILSTLFSLFNLFQKTSISITWYGISLNYNSLLLLAAVAYGAWTVAGCYRSMRAELQYTDLPDWWLAFFVFNFVFQYGFLLPNGMVFDQAALTQTFLVLFLEMLLLVYMLALSEQKDIVQFRKLTASFRKRHFNSFFRHAPLWVVSIPLALLAGFAALSSLMVRDDLSAISSLAQSLSVNSKAEAAAYFFAVLGFVGRDLGILLLLHFSDRRKRADATMLVYLAVLYFVLPSLSKDLRLAPLFHPDTSRGLPALAGLPLVEAVVVWYFLARRWGKIA